MISTNTSVNLVLPVGTRDHIEGLLTVDRFEGELNNEHHLRHIQEDMRAGEESGVDSTPTFFINGVRHVGNWDAGTLLNAMPHHGSYGNEHY